MSVLDELIVNCVLPAFSMSSLILSKSVRFHSSRYAPLPSVTSRFLVLSCSCASALSKNVATYLLDDVAGETVQAVNILAPDHVTPP